MERNFYENFEECMKKMTGKTVYCLYTGDRKIPWYNGFVATADAWHEASIVRSTNRWYYEHDIWRKTDYNVIGKFSNTQNDEIQMAALMEKLLK